MDRSLNTPGPFARSDRAHFDENRLVQNLQAHFPPGSVMIDVGAFVGSTARWFAENGWRVFAFEPDEKNRRELQQRFQGFNNVHIDSRAVADQIQEEVPFYTSSESRGISSLSAFTQGHELAATITVTTLASAIQEYQIERVDFLKIDVEGLDLMVLRGFPWDGMKPTVIECEFEDRKTMPLGYDFHDLAGFLLEKGYVVWVSEWHPVVRYGVQHDWRCFKPYPCELDDEAAWGNLIAYLPGMGVKVREGDLEGTISFNTRSTTKNGMQRAKEFLKRVLPGPILGFLRSIKRLLR